MQEFLFRLWIELHEGNPPPREEWPHMWHEAGRFLREQAAK